MTGGGAPRRKGLTGEREVALIYVAAGFEVRNLEGTGDHLVMGGRRPIHNETKRQERPKLAEWIAQAEREAPNGTVPTVTHRKTGQRWWVTLPLEDFADLVTR